MSMPVSMAKLSSSTPFMATSSPLMATGLPFTVASTTFEPFTRGKVPFTELPLVTGNLRYTDGNSILTYGNTDGNTDGNTAFTRGFLPNGSSGTDFTTKYGTTDELSYVDFSTPSTSIGKIIIPCIHRKPWYSFESLLTPVYSLPSPFIPLLLKTLVIPIQSHACP